MGLEAPCTGRCAKGAGATGANQLLVIKCSAGQVAAACWAPANRHGIEPGSGAVGCRKLGVGDGCRDATVAAVAATTTATVAIATVATTTATVAIATVATTATVAITTVATTATVALATIAAVALDGGNRTNCGGLGSIYFPAI